jgi:hypothetical protein
MSAGDGSFPAGEWRDGLQQAIDRWNQNPSKFRYDLTFNDSSLSRDNDQNEAWFSTDQSILDGAPAIAYMWWDCVDYWIFGVDAKMTETDVIFDADVDYTPDMTDKSQLWEYGGDFRPFQATAIHELGHGLGLGHEDDTFNVMGEDWTHIHVNGAKARPYAGEDAGNGAVKLYGLRSPKVEDLSVTHWRFDSPDDDGEYSEHRRTRMFDAADDVLPSSAVSEERRYTVSPGQTVRPEFTYENNGASRHKTATVGFYLSTNSTISRSDRKLGSTTLDLGRNTVATRKRSVEIPDDVSPGDYFLGAIIDDEREIAEKTGLNNATYLRIRVQ